MRPEDALTCSHQPTTENGIRSKYRFYKVWNLQWNFLYGEYL